MVFAEMTAPEIGALDRKTLVVVPVGSTEQHGPHLPVDTDARLVGAVAGALEARCGILLAPTVWLGHSPHHHAFGGTLSAGHALLAEWLTQLAAGFGQMGFTRLLFLNGHGGNRLPISMAQQELHTRCPALDCYACDYWQPAGEAIAALRKSGTGGMGHGGELETALCLYLAPGAVRAGLMRDAGQMDPNPYLRGEMFMAAKVAKVRDFDAFTDTGVFGAPTLASAEQGERFFAAILDALEGFVRALDAPPPHPQQEG